MGSILCICSFSILSIIRDYGIFSVLTMIILIALVQFNDGQKPDRKLTSVELENEIRYMYTLLMPSFIIFAVGIVLLIPYAFLSAIIHTVLIVANLFTSFYSLVSMVSLLSITLIAAFYYTSYRTRHLLPPTQSTSTTTTSTTTTTTMNSNDLNEIY